MQTKPIEIWKPIKGYEDFYEVSSFGRIKSFSKKKRGKLLHLGYCKGYYIVSLQRIGTRFKMCRVNRLVAEAFIPNPENKAEVNHKDGNKLNNHIWNLEWSTKSENQKHAFDTGLRKPAVGNKCNFCKLKESDIITIRERASNGDTFTNISKDYNTLYSNIAHIVKRRSWKHIP